MNISEPERFWSKVAVGPVDECWEWQAGRFQGTGYGAFRVPAGPARWDKLWAAHRVAWVLTYGPIPNGLHVLHHCDNRACCNPAHLFLGTNADNIEDAMRKGRMAKKLTKADVRAIRTLYASGEYYLRELAERFGVSVQLISKIVNRKCWAWLE